MATRRIPSRGEVYNKVPGQSALVKDHVALLFAWADERAAEVAQEHAGANVASFRKTAEHSIAANHDTWIQTVQSRARRVNVAPDQHVHNISGDIQAVDAAFFGVCEDVFAGRDDATSGTALSERMTALGNTLARASDPLAPETRQEKFKALAALIHSSIKTRNECIVSGDAKYQRKYVSDRATTLSSAGGIEAQ